MRTLHRSDLRGLISNTTSPCISLYQPTHRAHPENQQDPIRFRNLVRRVEEKLREKYPAREVRSLVDKFDSLIEDTAFWNHRADALAVLASPERFDVYDLRRGTKELVVVSDSFHLKPLFRSVQSADRFQILCLDRYEASLYEGNRDGIDRLRMDQVPKTIDEALGEELTEPAVNARTYATIGRGPNTGKAMYHGHGGKSEEEDIDLDRFFRVIDRGILQHHSRPSELPLLLATLPEYQGPFRKLSQNPYLLDRGIEFHPDGLTPRQLQTSAWEVIEPIYQGRLTKLLERYGTALAHDQASDDLGEVALAAMQGRIDVLLVEAEREVPGHIDPTTGEVQQAAASETGKDDLLDDLAEMAFRTDGEVVVVPAERMTGKSGVAAIYRY